jgi:hypothetical protein
MPTPGNLLATDRPRGSLILSVILAALLGGLAAQAVATTVERMSDEQLVQRSQVIARVVVEGSHSEWRDRAMVTLVTLRVDEWMKGGSGESMTLVLPGGIDVERRLSYTAAGVPALLPAGTRMFVFGSPSRGTPGAFVPTGLAQGMFFVREEAGSRAQVQRSFAGIRFQDGAPPSAGASGPEALERFRARIASLVAAARAGSAR